MFGTKVLKPIQVDHSPVRRGQLARLRDLQTKDGTGYEGDLRTTNTAT